MRTNPHSAPSGTPGAMGVKEAAACVGIGISLAYKLVRRGEWPCIRIGTGNNARCIIPTHALMERLETNVGQTIEL